MCHYCWGHGVIRRIGGVEMTGRKRRVTVCFGDMRKCVDEFLGACPTLETLLALLY